MLRIGICDDVADARLVLRSMLERILERRKIHGQFFEFSSGETLLRWHDHHAGELDLVFLDMELHELDGMETARRLRVSDAGIQLVFVTGYSDYVFDGYSVGALGYLLKPPAQEQLEKVLERAQAALVRELIGPMSVTAETRTGAFLCKASCISPPTVDRSPVSPLNGSTPSTVNWMPWRRRWAEILSESTSGIWFAAVRWSGWRVARRCCWAACACL